MKIIKSFQGLRIIAMLFIFFFHFKIHGEGTFANIYNKFFEGGYFAVTFFFVLSGLLTFNKLKDKDISFSIKNSFKFMLNKMKKVISVICSNDTNSICSKCYTRKSI